MEPFSSKQPLRRRDKADPSQHQPTASNASANVAELASSSTMPQRISSSISSSSSFKQQQQHEKEQDYLLDESKEHSRLVRWMSRQVSDLERQCCLFEQIMNVIRRIPPKWRCCCLTVWILGKLLLLVMLYRMTHRAQSVDKSNLAVTQQQGAFVSKQAPTKLLYIVTALAEYNNGLRSTVKGQDRLQEVLLPVFIDSVESMIAPPHNFDVDVFLILGYELRPERYQMILDRIPRGVGLEVWDDAIPWGYDKTSKQKLIPNTRTLARQHRYVIKDKFDHYDVFLAFEDDMRITGDHILHFLDMSDAIDALFEAAPESVPGGVPEDMDPRRMRFYGDMTKGQLKRVIPGFLRVEVLLDETLDGAQTELDPVPLDYDFAGQERHVDPGICCTVPNMRPNKEVPVRPAPKDVIIWETSVKALMVRELPPTIPSSPSHGLLDWTVVLLGPGKRMKEEENIGGYWSGREGAFGDIDKPSGGTPDMIGQQGGWMLTKEQIFRMNDELCMGSFLPPFDPPAFYEDGQQAINVESWSGSYQIFTGIRQGCNMQRLMSLHPDHFSKHLIYHVANNKQKQLKQSRMVRADHLLAQLNTVKKQAEKAKMEESKNT